MKNIFSAEVTREVIDRIHHLSPESRAKWGKMNVGQMLAHCCVAYELVYDNKHPKPGAVKKFFLKTFLKKTIVSDKPYKPGLPTAPEFIITGAKMFDIEKDRLISYIRKTQELGPAFFDGKESHSFGPLKTEEWNNMFYKHLDHHLTQFGV